MRGTLLALCLAIAPLGCKSSPNGAPPATQTDGATVTFADLKPDASPGTKGVLVLGGLNAPVGIVRKRWQDELTLDLTSHNESLESETYYVTTSEFGLKQAGGESFDPPLPLLKSPMKVGDSWTWKGNMWSGLNRGAEATIVTKEDKVYGEDGRQDEALLSEVKLSMGSGTRVPAERRLAFWFVKDKGVVKREIGSGSTRLPQDGK